MPVPAYIERLPKAELHLHIEGTLEPAMMLAFAVRNGVDVPYRTEAEIAATYRFRNLQEFLDLYYQGSRVLIAERDFYELTHAYLSKARQQNVLHAEISFDPQSHTGRGVPFATVIDGIHQALQDAKSEFGIGTKLIMCFLRHLDAEDAMTTLEMALPYRDRIAAVGLDSSEFGNPPAKFAKVFARARAEGFLAVAHAGEDGPADYVRQALDELRVARIDHGNRSLDDKALVQRLARTRTPLTLCPLSNLRLGVVPDIGRHPLREMMARGLMVTVNSDDPAYFGGYVNENYRVVEEALGLSEPELYQLARNSFEASFLSAPEKQALIAELDNCAGRKFAVARAP
ncbi:MAG: adenosine deaminase [Alphaproteobacteria bacterium]|jgi:adenosine deaminase|nr:adenosine deaminase [Alphaproteobacteria bacterium]